MGKLTVSCNQAVKFLKDHDFEFAEKLTGFQFPENTIKFKVKVKVILGIKLKPPIEIKLKSFDNGILHVEANTSDILEVILKIFLGTKTSIDNFLKKNKLDEFIKREEGKDLDFEIKVNKLLEERAKIKGITITNIQIKGAKLIIDFKV